MAISGSLKAPGVLLYVSYVKGLAYLLQIN